MENINAGSELPNGAGRSLLPHTGTNRDPTPSGASSLMRPVSDRIQFGNRTLWPSVDAAVTGSGLGRSLGLRPWNRLL